MRDSLEELRTVALYCILALALLAFGTVLSRGPLGPFAHAVSPEIAVAEYSTVGVGGGAVVPASCPSYAHVTGQCTSPTFSGSGGSGSGSSISINQGSTATLTWACPSSYNTASAGTNFSTGGAVSGSATVSPTQTTTYTVTCAPTGTYANVAVTVLNPTMSISASPTRIKSGGSSTVTWSATQVTANSCSVKKSAGTTFATGASGSQSTGALSGEETYTLTCSTAAGPRSVSVTVYLVPGVIEI